jgi:3-hydroxyacyl-[acyl-carrier-protein] dehydratase
MRFRQIHQISFLEPGIKIEATCHLSGQEDYLRDHFPRFAVMPGVMMLESLFQASALLVRATDGYNMGMVLLPGSKKRQVF